MTIVGFTGTARRPLPDAQRERLRQALRRYGPGHLHLGDAIHADATCHSLAKEQGSWVLIGHPPIIERLRAFCAYDMELPPDDYLARDRAIVDDSELLLACPLDFEEQVAHSGTWYTVRYALRCDKPVFLIWPDGSASTGTKWYSRRGQVGSVLKHLQSKGFVIAA